jgi:hypothetical protein
MCGCSTHSTIENTSGGSIEMEANPINAGMLDRGPAHWP